MQIDGSVQRAAGWSGWHRVADTAAVANQLHPKLGKNDLACLLLKYLFSEIKIYQAVQMKFYCLFAQITSANFTANSLRYILHWQEHRNDQVRIVERLRVWQAKSSAFWGAKCLALKVRSQAMLELVQTQLAVCINF